MLSAWLGALAMQAQTTSCLPHHVRTWGVDLISLCFELKCCANVLCSRLREAPLDGPQLMLTVLPWSSILIPGQLQGWPAI